MKQRDRFKELYLESIKNRTSVSDHELDGTNDQKNRAQDSSNLQTKIDELSKIIEQKDKALVDMEKCFEKYKTEKSLNEKLITEQLEKMRSEVRELTSKNCKIASAIEFKTEQLKINVRTIEMYKKQINSLEERNKNYEITISRHETTLK